jgi:hypothetical protein
LRLPHSRGGSGSEEDRSIKSKRGLLGDRFPRLDYVRPKELLVIRLALTLHLFVLLYHFLLRLLPFGLLVRC